MKRCNGLYVHWTHFEVKKKHLWAIWAPRGPQPNFFQNFLLRLNHLSIQTNDF